MRKNYFTVRQLIRERKTIAAQNIFNELQSNIKKFSDEEKYWFIRLQSELEIQKGNLDLTEKLLNEAFSLSKKLNLTSAELSSIHGKVGTVRCRKKKYKEAIPFIEKALSLTNDPPRRNYYHSRMLYCFFHLNEKESFAKILNITLNELLQSDIRLNIDSITNTIWDITQYAKESVWYEIIERSLTNFPTSSESEDLKNVVIEFFWARMARHQLNLDKYVQHMKTGLKICKEVNHLFFISMSLNYITMLENPFSENHRAIDLLKVCLKYTTKPTYMRIHILNKLGSNYRFIGNYKQAIDCLEEAISINKKIKNPWLDSFSHNTLGMIYTVFGDGESIQKALKHYKLSLDISRINNDPYGVGYTQGALGWLESNQGNLNEAKNWYELSISTFEQYTNSVPSIILLGLGELLSRMNDKNTDRIEELIKKAQVQIWRSEKRIDIGRYYNTLGNIALNRKQLTQAEKDFSQALDYGDYFEVEAQTLLGLVKVNLELFVKSDNRNYLEKSRLILYDLKDAVKSSFLILGEVDLILGLIEMYDLNFPAAKAKISKVIELAKNHNSSLLESKGIKQKETLDILMTHQKLQKVASSSMKNQLKTSQIKEAIEYLNELTRFLGPQITKKDGQ
jgi:tetratricopeptide (TPR) repeat protein